MTHRLLGSVAAAALGLAGTVVAAHAERPVSGFVGIGMGATFSDFDQDGGETGRSSTTFLMNGEGRINAWMSDAQTIQLDVEAEGTPKMDNYTGGPYDDGRVGALVGGHWSWRNPEALVGVFGAYTVQNNLDYDGTMNHAIFGAEAQWRTRDFTLYGQAGYAALTSGSQDYEPSGFTFARLVGRYFVTPNDKIEGEFGYGESGVNNYNIDATEANWGLGWQHRFDHSPYSATLGYAGFDYSVDPGDGWAREHILTIALNIHFGDETLAETNANGATLDMPNFERGFAWAWWVTN